MLWRVALSTSNEANHDTAFMSQAKPGAQNPTSVSRGEIRPSRDSTPNLVPLSCADKKAIRDDMCGVDSKSNVCLA